MSTATLLLPLVAALLSVSPLATDPVGRVRFEGGARPDSRVRTVDVRHVALDLRFDWTRRQAFGTATITLAPLATTGRINLDAARLIINRVTTRNGTVLTHAYDGGDGNDNLHISLERPYRAGEELTVIIDYRTTWVNASDPNSLGGSYGRGLRFLGPTSLEPKKRRQLWSMGEPESSRYWFPSVDTPSDLFTSEVSATVEKPLVAIASGMPGEVRDNADGTRTYRFKMETPHASHLTGVAVGEYVDVIREVDGVTLHNWGYPDEREAIEATIARLTDMVHFFGEKTGVRYPWRSYSQLFVQDFPGGAAHAGMATITDNMIDDAPTHADYRFLWDGQEAHVLASQWFGHYLPVRGWAHAWLREGLSRYFDGLFTEHANGREEFLLWNHLLDQGTYLADWNAGLRRPIVWEAYDSAETMTRDNYAASHAAQVLHLLRVQLGDERWWRAVRQYVGANAHRLVTTADFRTAVEDAAGEPMGWFFDQWFYRIGHPVFVVTERYDDGRRELTLTVRQTQRPDTASRHPLVEYFRGGVDVAIDGRVERVGLEAKAENVFTFSTPTRPKVVTFDHENAWIKELTFAKSIDDLVYQVEHDRDVTAVRWAMGELTRAALDSGTTTADRSRILATYRRVATSPAFWRIRMAAVQQLRALLVPTPSTAPVVLDEEMIELLTRLIATERSWFRSSALGFLGLTRDPRHADVYLGAMMELSHPVINAAAVALGRSGSPKAFPALVQLMDVPSWKGENRISGLNGLRELRDPRGLPHALKAFNDLTGPHWMLATSTWDHRLASAETIAALGKGATAYPIVRERFRKSLADGDINDIFMHAMFVNALGDPRGREVYAQLRERFKGDANAMAAVEGLEAQFKPAGTP